MVALLVAASLMGAQAASASRSILRNSIKDVVTPPVVGPANPHRAFISRNTLKSDEAAATMEFEVALKMRNFSELQQRVAQGEHISSQEMAAKYDPLEADYQAITNWLTSQGFKITHPDEHHMAIFASGKVSQVQQALQVNFARVTLEGQEYTSAVTAPSVPGTISPLLVGINGLQPHLKAHKHLLKQQTQPQPNASSGNTSYIPSQIAQAYNASGLYTTNITGSGQMIAIVIDTFPATNDLITFWQNNGVNQSIHNIQFVQVVSGSLPSPSGEETLDVEWSSSIAPGAKVRVYATTSLNFSNLDQAYQQIYTDATTHPELGIHQMSLSFGLGETYTTSSQVQTDDQYFVKLSSAGVTVFASSGDGGSTPGAGTSTDESGPLQAESPASDPNVTSVGGTSLTLDSNNNETSESVWNNNTGSSGGGTSIYFSRPSWQTGTGVPSGTMRLVPDIACAADPNTGAILYLNGSTEVVGGTSWSSPTCAAFCALINQSRTNAGLSSVGLLGPQIYPLMGTTNFRDITSGNNATSGSSGNYNATTGYDEATGIGVPLVQTLAETLVGSSTLVGVQMQPAVQSILPGQNATITVSASGNPVSYQWQRMPTGSTTWSNLSNDGTYGGSDTASLSVQNATIAMSGDQFQCVVTYAGTGVVPSISPSVLIVETPLIVTTLAGKVRTIGNVNATGTTAQFAYPSGIAINSSGNLYIADYSNNAIRKVTPDGVVTTPYGSLTGASGSTNSTGGNNARFNNPNAIAADSSNNLYVADTGNDLIRKITPAGAVSTLAGKAGFSGVGYVDATGTAARFNSPEGIAVDSAGNVYVADTGNNVIRKITPGGSVSTLAGARVPGGSGIAGYLDATGTAAEFNAPDAVAVDGSGNVYVADFYNDVVRKITSAGVVTTLAGQGGVAGDLDGPNGTALFNTPVGVAVDASNNIYVADSQLPPVTTSTSAANNLLRRISPAGVVSTLAGQAGVTGSANGTGASAQFYSPQAVAIDSAGTIYVADTFNQTIRAGVTALPVVAVSATQPNAAVYGPTPGQFTVSRTGSTFTTLTVNYSVAGTAVSNVDYTALAGTLTLSPGTSSAIVAVNPLFHNQSTASETVQLTLTPAAAYTVGADVATVTITNPTPYQAWKLNEFGSNAYVSGIGGDQADPNHNGVPNILEYAFGSNPLQSGTNPSPQVSIIPGPGGKEYLAITYTQINNDPSLTCTVQVTSDVTLQTDQWNSGPTYTTVVSQQVNGNTTQMTVRDNTPVSQASRRFIRMQASEN